MDPVEKKAITYRKNHCYGTEFPYAFRRDFPRKKRGSLTLSAIRLCQLSTSGENAHLLLFE